MRAGAAAYASQELCQPLRPRRVAQQVQLRAARAAPSQSSLLSATPSTPARAAAERQKPNMAQDGLYTKLHLAVRARTQPGQVVLVSG